MTSQPAPAAGFSADWLHQREPFDAAARDGALLRLALDARLAAWCQPDGAPLRVIDLACGTGANLRWLAPRLGGAQQWLVVDHDAALLRRWPGCLAAGERGNGVDTFKTSSAEKSANTVDRRGRRDGSTLQFSGLGFHAEIVRRQLDLAHALESLPWHAARLVTGSALLDLVGAVWLQRLVAAAATARVALLMALSVDGRHRWAPGDADDAAVLAIGARVGCGFGHGHDSGSPGVARALRGWRRSRLVAVAGRSRRRDRCTRCRHRRSRELRHRRRSP